MLQGSDALRAWRKRRGFTQAQAAEAFGASSFMQVSRWERGETAPARSMADTIERVTDGDVPIGSWDRPASKEARPVEDEVITERIRGEHA
jgi:transcriptional regulator with XRE-family HTH domain